MNWDEPHIVRLVAAYRSGGRRAAIAAFPELRPAQVYAALRRYIDQPPGTPLPLAAKAEVRMRIAAIPIDLFIERIHTLTTWSPLHGAP